MAEDSLRSQIWCQKAIIIDFMLSQSNFPEILLQFIVKCLNRDLLSHMEYFSLIQETPNFYYFMCQFPLF